jgi:hypothetical protein
MHNQSWQGEMGGEFLRAIPKPALLSIGETTLLDDESREMESTWNNVRKRSRYSAFTNAEYLHSAS